MNGKPVFTVPDKTAWEGYARRTFDAHANNLRAGNRGKLRFLQYVTKDTAPWWEIQRENGAVLL
jgi:hypothetical protein